MRKHTDTHILHLTFIQTVIVRDSGWSRGALETHQQVKRCRARISLAVLLAPGHPLNCIFRHCVCFILMFWRIVNEMNEMKMKRRWALTSSQETLFRAAVCSLVQSADASMMFVIVWMLKYFLVSQFNMQFQLYANEPVIGWFLHKNKNRKTSICLRSLSCTSWSRRWIVFEL